MHPVDKFPVYRTDKWVARKDAHGVCLGNVFLYDDSSWIHIFLLSMLHSNQQDKNIIPGSDISDGLLHVDEAINSQTPVVSLIFFFARVPSQDLPGLSEKETWVRMSSRWHHFHGLVPLDRLKSICGLWSISLVQYKSIYIYFFICYDQGIQWIDVGVIQSYTSCYLNMQVIFCKYIINRRVWINQTLNRHSTHFTAYSIFWSVRQLINH